MSAVSEFLHTVKYNKDTSYLDPKEEMFFLHFLQNDPSIGEYIRSQMYRNPHFRSDILKQPVCPHCEAFMFFHKGGAQCPKCATWVSESQTHSVKEYVRGGYYK